MSDERLDQLAESARNRGLKLVRSRVRTPGKRRFGKVGLTDKTGKPVFGMDAKGPTAKPEEVENFLRNLGAKDWGASLGVAVMPRKRKRPQKKAALEPANDSEPERERRPKPKSEPTPKPKAKPAPPPPKPKVRDAKPSDSPVLTELIRFLGHEIDEKAVRKNLRALAKAGEAPLVAVEDRRVIGLIGTHRTPTVHRPAPVGRITILVVAKNAQGLGIGKMLVAAAEEVLGKAGCKIIEVTSNERRAEAHAFYRHLGYERTSIRFMKKL